MRVTAFMLFKQFTDSVSQNLAKLGAAQEKLGTGRRITKPSDDVVLTRMSMSYKVEINAVVQYQRNVNEGVGRLGFTENLISSARQVINRARELAVAESSDTSTAETREITSFEIQNLRGELLSFANTKFRNKYLFSGFLTDTEAFDASGNYQGDQNDIEVYIKSGIKARINVLGSDAFTDETKLITDDLTSEILTGNIRITTGGGTPVYLDPVRSAFVDASPEEIRDTINAPMTGWYADDTAVVGDGKLTFKVGTNAPVTLDVNGVIGNDTVADLVDDINLNVTGVKAGIVYEDTGAPQKARIFLRPTTPGTHFTVDVSEDSDGSDVDLNGLSALVHNDIRSNLTENALGIQSFVINDKIGKRLLFSPNVPNTTYTIEVDEDNDGVFNEDPGPPDEVNKDGLSYLYHIDSTTTNLNDHVTFFSVFDNLEYSLTNNDRQGVRESIYLLDGVLDTNLHASADIGSTLKYMEEQKGRLEENNIAYEKNLSQIQDADIGEVALEYSKIQATLESLRISSLKALSQSLFDFLR